MRAIGKVAKFAGGNNKQREHLNDHVDDYNDLVKDVEDLSRKQQGWTDELRIILVDIGTESDVVQFVYADMTGSIAGTVAEIDGE